MADIFGSVAAPRLNWSQPTSSAQTAQIILASRAQSLKEQEYQRQLDEDQRQREAIHSLVGSLHQAGVNDEPTMAAYIAANPEAAVNKYTAPLIQHLASTFSTFARIKESSTDSMLARKAREWQQTQNQELFQAAPEDYPKLTATFDENGRWTDKTSNVFAELSPKIDEWKRKEALLKPQVIGSQIRSDALIQRTEDLIASREKIAEQKYGTSIANINGQKVYHAGDKFFTLDENNVATTVFDASKGKVTALDKAEFSDALKSKSSAESKLKELTPDSPQFDAQTQLWNKAQNRIQAIRKKYEQSTTASTPSEQKPNVTKDEYDKLKSGDLYWWNGKQIPKQ